MNNNFICFFSLPVVETNAGHGRKWVCFVLMHSEGRVEDTGSRSGSMSMSM